jgi:clan AA aspartic protease (TIGR02281 family)
MRVYLTFLLVTLLTVTANAQFLNGNLEKKYILGDFQGAILDASDLGGEARYSKKSVIGDEQVSDYMIFYYLMRPVDRVNPYYTYQKVEIGRLNNGAIRLVATTYRMVLGAKDLYDVVDNYILPLDGLDLFDSDFSLDEEKQSISCNGIEEEMDYGDLLVSLVGQRTIFASWRSKVSPKLNCEKVEIYHQRFWDESYMFSRFSNDISAAPIPQDLKTKYWWKVIENLRGVDHWTGGQLLLSYEIEENILVKILGLEDQIYESVQLIQDKNNQFHIKPKLNGTNDYEMLFDTGASLTTLSEANRKTFLVLGLVKETGQSIGIVNADGVQSQKVVYTCSFKIGSKEVRDIRVVFTEGTPLFGMNILNHLDGWKIQGDELIFKK